MPAWDKSGLATLLPNMLTQGLLGEDILVAPILEKGATGSGRDRGQAG